MIRHFGQVVLIWRMPEENRYTEMGLLEFQDRFPTERVCLDYLIKMRWPEGVGCLCCEDSKLDYIKTRKAFE
jgi:hypothetical protein